MSTQLVANTPEWHEARRQGMGGSDAAIPFGLSPFMDAFELFAIKRGTAPPKEMTEAQSWGLALESAIRTEFMARRGCHIHMAKPMTRNANLPSFMFANVDGLVVDKTILGMGVFEAKNLSQFTSLKDGLPEHIWLQVQHNMAVTNLDWAAVAILVGGQRLETFDVQRDEEAIDLLVDGETEFWRRVELNDPPPPSGLASTSALLRKLYPEGNGRTVILDDPAAATCARFYDECKTQVKEISKTAAAYQQDFIQRLGKNEVAVIPGYGKVSYKTVRFDDEQVIDAERLSRDYPEAYAACVSFKAKKSQRRFTTKPLKGEPEEEGTEE